MTVLFFEATTEALIRRFSETRRPHPLAGRLRGGGDRQQEREILQSIRERADMMIDSSAFNVHELRTYLFDNFGEEGRETGVAVRLGGELRLQVRPSRGGRLLFDARFLPNPYFVDGLRHKTGLDAEVREYLSATPDYDPFYDKMPGC